MTEKLKSDVKLFLEVSHPKVPTDMKWLTRCFFLFSVIVSLPFTSESRVSESIRLCDFEREEELKQLGQIQGNYAITPQHATHGKNSLKVAFGAKRSILSFWQLTRKDWSEFEYLGIDIFNPQDGPLVVSFQVSDTRAKKYGQRHHKQAVLHDGMNHLAFPLGKALKGADGKPLDPSRITSLFFAVRTPAGQRQVTLHFDNLRLETEKGFKESQKRKPGESPELAEKKKEAYEAFTNLEKLIKKAKGKGVDTTYFEAVLETARVGLETRFPLPWFQSEKKKSEIFRYVISSCESAVNNLDQVMQGMASGVKVPPRAKRSDLENKGPYFALKGTPHLVFGMHGRKVSDELSRFFSPNNWFINSRSVYGGSIGLL
jgi:hypothetical protein